MDYDLSVPILLKKKELIFNTKFLQLGYSYKFEVDVNGIFFFEPDEERNFRAIIDPSIDRRCHKLDKELIQLIAEALVEILK